MRSLRAIVMGAVVLYLALVAGLFAVMHEPLLFGKLMARVPEPLFMVVPFERLWFVARAGRLRPGEVAPDFQLWTSDKKSRVQLSSFRGHKPVVLIFGSYT